MATLVTVEMAAERTGKSERTIWRYVAKLEEEGKTVTYRVPGLDKTVVDFDLVKVAAMTAKRGNPRHREARESRNL